MPRPKAARTNGCRVYGHPDEASNTPVERKRHDCFSLLIAPNAEPHSNAMHSHDEKCETEQAQTDSSKLNVQGRIFEQKRSREENKHRGN